MMFDPYWYEYWYEDEAERYFVSELTAVYKLNEVLSEIL